MKNNTKRIVKRVALGLVLGILFLGAIYLERSLHKRRKSNQQ